MGVLSKSTRVNRNEFLQALEAVTPGLSPKPLVEFHNSFVFRNGRVQTFNDEIACVFRTKLPKEVKGIVASKSLLAYLTKIKDGTVEIRVDEDKKEFTVTGKGKRADFMTAFEAAFPIDAVEKPGKDSWSPLSPRFSDAVGMAAGCVGKDEGQSVLTCVHVHPKFVEATDNYQWCRVRCKTPTPEPFLVKGEAIKHIRTLDVTEIAQTESWVHFRNPAGLVFSCRRLAQKFADTSGLTEPGAGGRKMTLPPELAADVEAADVAASEDKDANIVIVELEPGKLRVSGIGVTIRARHWRKSDYAGKPRAFMIQPAMLIEICKRDRNCVVEEKVLRMSGSGWTYITELAAPTEIKKAAEQHVTVNEVE